MKFLPVLVSFALLLGIFGCAAQPPQAPPAAFNGPQAGEAAPPPSGAPQEGQNISGAAPTPAGEKAQGSQTSYLAYASLMQYDLQSRSKMADKVAKAFAIEVDISDVSGGFGTDRPLPNPQKATVKLIGPSSSITLAQGPISQSDYDSLPVSAAWPVMPGYTDPLKTQFTYAKNGALLAGGNYELQFDADGDGKPEGEADFIVPGAIISNPAFGSRQSANGFELQWSQSGSPKETSYTISTGRGFAGLDNYLANSETLPAANIAVTPEKLHDSGTIETGNYLLNFQLEPVPSASGLQDYMMGKSKEKTVFFMLNAREAHMVLYSFGDFCHCDDAFAEGPCTVDDIQADPLCQ